MFLRIFSACLALSLAGCGSPKATESDSADNFIECALSGAAAFLKNCAVEQGTGNTLILRHADGGFRRIAVAADGTFASSDGADPTEAHPMPDGWTELRMGSDRYLMPPRQ